MLSRVVTGAWRFARAPPSLAGSAIRQMCSGDIPFTVRRRGVRQIEAVQGIDVEGVTVVRGKENARKAVALLQEDARSARLEGRTAYHACDTETIGMDVKKESVHGRAIVICASVYAGPHLDFGTGPCLWIDNYGEWEGTLDPFREYLEDERVWKVWHNYGFDRHVLYNHGIDVKGFGGDTMHMARLWDTSRLAKGYSLEALSHELLNEPKITIKDLFGFHKPKKDGTPSKAISVPNLEELQQDGDERLPKWIKYSAYDAKLTWELRDALEKKLRNMAWHKGLTLMDFYLKYWRPFAELLTDMERAGIKTNVEYLRQLEPMAAQQAEEAEAAFKDWAMKLCPDVKYMNVGSVQQKQHFFFSPVENPISGEFQPREKVFQTLNTEGIILEGKKKALKNRDFTLIGQGIPPVSFTKSGWPAAGAEELRKLCGTPFAPDPVYGVAYDFYGGGEGGEASCKAIAQLCQVASIQTLLQNFIIPLQQQTDANDRIHASLNINTETGRLSCRNPNLQNQPALDKDIFKIRSAFTCEEGNTLIVADYGQLELRLLAHVSKCKSMIEAFKVGGDFHSRTAMGMYPYIAQAVENGEVLLEWDSEKGTAPAPLLKDVYGTERRKAKMLNFSIAYGKTAMGLSRDWGVSMEEAQQTVNLWFSDRPEVLQWQKRTRERARQTGYVQTLMGRRRNLKDINSPNRARRGHAERAAINTPLQGGAADVVMKAMLLLHANEELRSLGWQMLLQIHDELILEGPIEHKDRALEIVVGVMSRPMEEMELEVELVVDAKVATNWMEAK